MTAGTPTPTIAEPAGDARARRRRPGAQAQAPTFRLDIQGLRAVAVGVVVLYHAGLPWLPGGFVGVDVFFVISGFLITQGLVRELSTSGRISLAGFYARRARRILPAATVTLLGVVALAVALLPRTRWLDLGRDVVTSAAYVVNWDLAERSVEYLARDQAASPLQHFWSLAVEEQFYLVWPLTLVLVVGGLAWLRRVRGSARGHSAADLGVALAVVALPSLAWSVHLTSADPGPAYFVTTTRMWELAIGAGLAILGTRLQAHRTVAAVVGVLGLAAIVVAAVTYTSATPFPGTAALLPTLGAAAVIWAGAQQSGTPASRLLSLRPMVWVGGLSYSLYLWHWPLIVIATAQLGELRIRHGLLVAALSFVPAWLSLRFVERPALRSRALRSDAGRSLLLGAVCTLVGVVAGLGLQNVALTSARDAAAAAGGTGGAGSPTATTPGGPVVDPAVTPGAAALTGDPALGAPVDSFPVVVPDPLTAAGDAPQIDGHGCTLDEASTAAAPCSFGDLDSDVVLALVGDSHADHLVPGVEAAAVANGWRLDVYTRGSCPFTATTVDLDGRPNVACDERNANVTAALLEEPPSMLLVATSRYQVHDDGDVPSLEESKPAMAEGFADAWEPFTRAGIPVVSFRDTPRPDVLVPECVLANPDRLTECAMERSDILWPDPPEVTAADGKQLVHVVDLTDSICPTDRCAAVVGGVLVYRDGNHLTATYSRSLGGVIGQRLASVLAGGG